MTPRYAWAAALTMSAMAGRSSNAATAFELLRSYPRKRLQLHVLDMALSVYRRLLGNAGGGRLLGATIGKNVEASTVLLLPSTALPMILVLLVLGLPVGPLMVTVFAIGGLVAPHAGRDVHGGAPGQRLHGSQAPPGAGHKSTSATRPRPDPGRAGPATSATGGSAPRRSPPRSSSNARRQ